MIYCVAALLVVVLYEVQRLREDVAQLGKTNLVVRKAPAPIPGVPRIRPNVRETLRRAERNSE